MTVTYLRYFTLIIMLHGADCAAAVDLHRDLLSNYSRSIVPRPSPGEPCRVEIGTTIHQLVDVDIVSMSIQLLIWSYMRWTDPKIDWDPAEYEGTNIIAFELDEDFVPDIVIYEALDMKEIARRYMSVIARPGGDMRFENPRIVKTLCSINIRNYPFDEHSCEVSSSSWGFNKSHIDIYPLHADSSADLSFFEPNSQFEMLSANWERLENVFPEDGTFIELNLHVVIRRYPFFYIVNLLFPTYIIGILGGCVFYLPGESGEKVGLAMAIVLALTVNLLMVSEKLPETDNIPIISYFYVASIGMSAVCVMLNVFTMNLANPVDLEPVPERLKIFVNLLSCVVIGHKKESDQAAESGEVTDGDGHSQTNSDAPEQTKSEASASMYEVSLTTEEEMMKDWRRTARLIERAIGVIYTVVFLVLAVGFLIFAKYG